MGNLTISLDEAVIQQARVRAIQDAARQSQANRAGAYALYTEDLTHEQPFGPLTIVNPFLPAN